MGKLEQTVFSYVPFKPLFHKHYIDDVSSNFTSDISHEKITLDYKGPNFLTSNKLDEEILLYVSSRVTIKPLYVHAYSFYPRST